MVKYERLPLVLIFLRRLRPINLLALDHVMFRLRGSPITVQLNSILLPTFTIALDAFNFTLCTSSDKKKKKRVFFSSLQARSKAKITGGSKFAKEAIPPSKKDRLGAY